MTRVYCSTGTCGSHDKTVHFYLSVSRDHGPVIKYRSKYNTKLTLKDMGARPHTVV